MAKVDVYFKQIILKIRVLMRRVFVLTLGTVMLWKFFAPTTNDVSDRVSNNLLHAINSENIGGLFADENSGHQHHPTPWQPPRLRRRW